LRITVIDMCNNGLEFLCYNVNKGGFFGVFHPLKFTPAYPLTPAMAARDWLNYILLGWKMPPCLQYSTLVEHYQGDIFHPALYFRSKLLHK